MKKTLLTIYILFCFIYLPRFLYCQEAVVPSGGMATGTNGSISYTIGQVFYAAYNDEGGIIIQGVQQPYVVSVVTAIEDDLDITLECEVYPNPVVNYLTLTVDRQVNKDLFYQLFDLSGRLIEVKDISESRTIISMATKQKTIYILKVFNSNKEIRTFKIIKQ